MHKIKTSNMFMKDTIVKKLYSSKTGQKCLAKTVCQILGLPFESVSFKIMPTDIGTNKNIVNSEADLLLESNEAIVNVEVNTSTSKSIQNKNNAYVCQLVLRQLKNMEAYKNKLKKVYQLNLNNFDIARDNRFIVINRLIDIKTHKEYHPILEIIDVNLAKLQEEDYNNIKKNEIEYLLYLLVCNDEDELRKIYNGDELMEKMIDEAKILTDNFDLLLYYDREKLKKQEAYELGEEAGKEIGQEIGFKAGVSRKEKELTINMLKKKISDELICEITGLSIDDINELKKEL